MSGMAAAGYTTPEVPTTSITSQAALSCWARPMASGRQRLAEPHHLGAQQVAAVGAARRLLLLLGEVLETVAAVAAVDAAEAVHGAVQLDHVGRAGALVQAVDVLGDDAHLGTQRLQLGDGVVAGVGLGLAVVPKRCSYQLHTKAGSRR